MEKERKLRSMSDPTEMCQIDSKKTSGLSHFFHKLPFLSGRHHHHHHHHSHHSSHTQPEDDEFCDIEEEMNKTGTNENGHKTAEDDISDEGNQREVKVVVMVNDCTDTELDDMPVDDETARTEENGEKEVDSQGVAGQKNTTNVAKEKPAELEVNEEKNDKTIDEEEDEEGTLHEPPLSPLPPPFRSCLRHGSCSENKGALGHPPPLRKRSVSMPEGDPNIIFRLNRHVHFSPDTVEPTARNCRYREWIERHSNHQCAKSSINIKHEKRMQQLRQNHSLDINDYLSQGRKRYHNAMVASPMPTLGCDIFM